MHQDLPHPGASQCATGAQERLTAEKNNKHLEKALAVALPQCQSMRWGPHAWTARHAATSGRRVICSPESQKIPDPHRQPESGFAEFHGPERCGNNTSCCSAKGVVLARKGGGVHCHWFQQLSGPLLRGVREGPCADPSAHSGSKSKRAGKCLYPATNGTGPQSHRREFRGDTGRHAGTEHPSSPPLVCLQMPLPMPRESLTGTFQ